MARWLDDVSAWKQREVMRHSEDAEAEDAVRKEVKAKRPREGKEKDGEQDGSIERPQTQ